MSGLSIDDQLSKEAKTNLDASPAHVILRAPHAFVKLPNAAVISAGQHRHLSLSTIGCSLELLDNLLQLLVSSRPIVYGGYAAINIVRDPIMQKADQESGNMRLVYPSPISLLLPYLHT